jgi:hypothetical protein
MPRVSESDKLLNIFETLLKVQLKAIESLRRSGTSTGSDVSEEVEMPSKNKRMSQTKMAYEILLRAGSPLHIQEIVRQIESIFGIQVNRDTLVSAVVKKITQKQLFVRTDKNTYGLLGRDSL